MSREVLIWQRRAFLRSQLPVFAFGNVFLALLALIVAWGVVTALALTDKVVFGTS